MENTRRTFSLSLGVSGPLGNAVVVGGSALAILRMLQNAIALGAFRAASGSGTSAMSPTLGSRSNG